MIVELRSVPRYRVALAITFFWGTGTTFLEGMGTSRDLSIHGAFILTPVKVPYGSEIWLKISIPPMQKGLEGSEMQGEGRVVRVQDGGFAVKANIGFFSPNRRPRARKKATLETSDEFDQAASPEMLEYHR